MCVNTKEKISQCIYRDRLQEVDTNFSHFNDWDERRTTFPPHVRCSDSSLIVTVAVLVPASIEVTNLFEHFQYSY